MSKSRESKTRDTYYREAGSWTVDRAAASQRLLRYAWLVAACASIVAVCEAIALIALTPLKTIVPYTLMVDRQTGYVQALSPLDAQKISPDSALTQSFLVQYVIARESFNMASIQSDYRKTALWSAGGARRDYLRQMQVPNPASPLAQYPRSTTVETFIRSVSPLARDRAMVRFATWRRDADRQPRLLGDWVAVISYRYSTAPLSLEDRFINPLGFQVLNYHKNQEALPAVEGLPNGSDTADISSSTPIALSPQRAGRIAPAGDGVR